MAYRVKRLLGDEAVALARNVPSLSVGSDSRSVPPPPLPVTTLVRRNIHRVPKDPESEALLRSIVDAAPFGAQVYELSSNERLILIAANQAADRLFGLNHETLLGRSIDEVFPGLAGTPILDAYHQVALTGNRYEDDQIEFDQGMIRGAFEVHAFRIGNRRVGIFYRDVTERRNAELALRQSEARYRTLVETAQDGILLTRPEGTIMFANSRAAAMLGERDPDALSGSSILMYIAPVDHEHFQNDLQHVIDGKPLAGAEYTVVRCDGTHFPAEFNASIMNDETGRPLSVMTVVREITQRKKAEEELRSSLREKEVLIKEIHHRVKNNLQVISSLLSLQSSHVKDPETLELFRESQNRVKSMALVHEKLYRSENMVEVDFGEYVRTVAMQLVRSYGKGDVSCVVEADGVRLAIDDAIPCGLIVNELVSNALKHAFPHHDEGMIRIRVRTQGRGITELSVSDNGIGFPEDCDFRTLSSMGMMLVTSLVQQLHGKVALDQSSGTTFTIQFPSA